MGELTRETLDKLMISLGGRAAIGCTKHPDDGSNAIYQDGTLRVLCRTCGFEAGRIRVAFRDALDYVPLRRAVEAAIEKMRGDSRNQEPHAVADVLERALPKWGCALDSDWCDGRVCEEKGIDCPNAAIVREAGGVAPELERAADEWPHGDEPPDPL